MNIFPSDMHKLVASIESGNDMFAMRFEEAFYNRLNPVHCEDIKRAHKCSTNTSKMIGATSWGLYQILGVNIYSDMSKWRYGGMIVKYVENASLQHMCFSAYLRSRGIDFTVDDLKNDREKLTRFVIKYNGSGNIADYSAKIMDHIKELKL